MKNTVQLMTVQEVARRLGYSPASIYRLAGRLDFPQGIKLAGAVRFDPRDVEDYIKARVAGKKYVRRNRV